MKRIAFFLITVLLAASCKQAQDTRYFAPAVEFASAQYTVSAGDGGLDISLQLSRPATQAFNIGLNVDSSLEAGVQYRMASTSVAIASGQQDASLHVDLVDDEIWVESAWIELTLRPGERYTLDPATNSTARVDISKHVVIPILQLSIPEDQQEINAYLVPPVTLRLAADKAPLTDLQVPLTVEGLTAGEDFLVDGGALTTLTLPANATEAAFTLQFLRKDQPGYDARLTLSMSSEKGKYGVGNEGASVAVHLTDPPVDLSPLFRTSAQAGEGHQIRQAILGADGETWNGNTAANFTLSAQGSSYLKSLRNMGTTYGCLSNEVGLHALRLVDFFPNLRTTSGDAILDYGRNNNTRGFSPVDSLFRFVLDPGSTTQGTLALNKPRTFTAYVGDYTLWKNAWENDSKATGGNISASTSPIITRRVDVVLEKLEGRFNLADASNTLLFTAWFSCDSPQFMEGVDLSALGAVQEDGLWKVQYKLWPR
jgi:hypothetical protein